MYGKGIFVGADSTQYDGDWKANMRQGMGTAIDSDDDDDDVMLCDDDAAKMMTML